MDPLAAPRPTSSRKSFLHVLGPVHLEAPPGGNPQMILRQPKKLALLVYLAMTPGAVPRERLTSLFWPDSEPELARASLRQYLSQFRRTLVPEVVDRIGSYGVGLDPKWLTVDAMEFQALMDAGATEDALELYRGTFLDGFFLDHLDEFDEWVASARRTLGARAAAGAWRLALRAQGDGDPTRAAFWAKRSLSLSPLEEARVRAVIQLLEGVGDRAGALRTYRGLEEWLAREFECQPSAETRATYRSVLEGARPAEEPAQSLQPRRVQSDRRSGTERRLRQVAFRGPERRSGAARRVIAERRAGRDRRRPLDPGALPA